MGILLFASATQFVPKTSDQGLNANSSFIQPNSQEKPEDRFGIAEDTSLEGILDPVIVERRGYASSGSQFVRTDISPTIEYDLPLDDDHGWVGSQAEVNIVDLKRLYVANGTFEDGIAGQDVLNDTQAIDFYPYGWNSTAYNPPSQTQIQVSGYDNSSRKIVFLENQGKKIGPTGKQYDHVAGTEVIWFQHINNTPYTENFYLSFSYYYLRGPLGSGVIGEGRVFVKVDGNVIWNKSIPDLPARATWYSVDNLPVTIPSAGSVLNFSIGFVVDETFDLNADEDNDGDTYADGIANTVYLTTWFDDISFVGQTAPSFQEVDMQFSAADSSTPITGSSGDGYAAIINATNWDTNPVPIAITSNTSISFNYETRLLSHKYASSNSDTNPLETGVNYIVSPGSSPELSFYTYVGTLGTYQDFTLIVQYPEDWKNATILEPQSGDVTGQCMISEGMLVIPNLLLIDRLGWWYITFQSPNYANSLSPEIYDSSTNQWNAETVFRSGNQSRIAVTIGAGANTPHPLNLVNVTWIMPSGVIWYDESISGGIAGHVFGNNLTIGATNTTAGEWNVLVSWQNSTEVAYGETIFEVHHSTLLYPAHPVIQTDAGLVATVFVIYKDAENDEFLMENTVIITGNWSTSTIVFQPNDNRNQWEADFDTSLLGPGEYLVIINASRPYFDDATCMFIVQSVGTNNDLLLEGPIIPMSLQETYTTEVRFTDQHGAAIAGAHIHVDIEPVSGLAWGNIMDLGNGNYSFDLISTISNTYTVKVSASRDSYEAAEATLIVDVGEIATNLQGLSVGTAEFTSIYNLTLLYTNGTGFGLTGANVNVEPILGLTVGSIQDLGNGYYSIILNPDESGTFTILIEVSLENHQTRIHQFTLVTTRISSQLTYTTTGSTISIDQNCTVYFNFTSSILGGIESGTLGIIGNYHGLAFMPIQEIGGGIYLLVVIPSNIGTYYVAFYASADNHVNATAFFPLTVVPVQTEIHASDGISSAYVSYSEVYQLMVFFERESPSANITGATIEVFFDGLESLNWSVSSVGNGYLVFFNADVLGRWSLTITANATGYEPGNMRFVLFVVELETELSGTNPSTLMYYGRTYSFSYVYRLASNGTGISGATNVTTGVDSSWLVFDDLKNGSYLIYLTPGQIGSFDMKISLQAYGLQHHTIEFEFKVERVPLDIEADSFIWNWGQDLVMSITLRNGFNELVSDANVTYYLLRRDVEVSWGTMEMTGPGVYTVILQPAWYGDNGYEVRITVDLEYHILDETFVRPITEQIPVDLVPMWWFQTYGVPTIAAVSLIAFTLIGYRTYSGKKHREYIEALDIKRRFDDVGNLIGIIILHAKSGLPIYSSVLKGGFEEGMISAFITAITHFRHEFVPNGEDDMTFEVIPISDIIRAVPTRNLVCAFITVSKASMQQEDRMIAFAREIGSLFDDVLEDRPKEFRDEAMALTIQYVFENKLDGFLLKYYKRATASKFPRELAPLERAMSDYDTFECASAQSLASSMSEQEIDEAKGCAIVLHAIESEVITPCDKHEIHMHKELDWQLFQDADDLS